MFTILYSPGGMNAAKQSYSRFSKNSKKGAHDQDHVPSVYEHSHRVKLSIKSKPNKIFSIHKFLSIRCVCTLAKFPRSDKMFVRSVGINSNLMFFSHSSRVYKYMDT